MTARGRRGPLDRPRDRARILDAIRRCHRSIVRDVRAFLQPLVARGRYDDAMRAHGEGVGDLTYRLDAVAEGAVDRLADALGRIAPCRILCEGPGEIVRGGAEPVLRVLVDPVDGTRNLMADLRSAWVLTGVAAESDGRTPTTADLVLGVQTEIPATDRRHSLELVAERGRGCVSSLRTLAGRRSSSDPIPFRAPRRIDLRSGYFSFLRYLPREREAIARVEVEFFARAQREAGLDPRRVYDDQWLCAAGQLALVATGRMRMFADLRAHLAARARVATVASHAYDLAAMLIAVEAGSPVLGVDLEPLRVPLDLETNVSFVAFANDAARRTFAPLLRASLAASEPAAVAALRRASR